MRGNRDSSGSGPELPGDESGSGVARHDALAGLEHIRRGAALVAGGRAWSLSDGEVRDAVRDGAAALAAVEAAWLGLVRELDGRPGAVAGARPGRTAVTFLTHALRVSTSRAHADVAAAHAIDPDAGALPGMGAALAAGEVSRAHVDVAVRALSRIPHRLAAAVDAEGARGSDRVDAFLTEQSTRFPPVTTERLARHLLATLDPSGTDRYDPEAFARRSLTCAVDSTGMLVGHFQLDPAAGAALKAALDHYAAPVPAGPVAAGTDEQLTLMADDRTRPQRYADALTTIARSALTAGGTVRGEPPHVLVLATPGQLRAARGPGEVAQGQPGRLRSERPGAEVAGLATCAQTGPITSGTLARLACDAVLQSVLLAPGGAVLDLGRSVRTASTAQRRALTARDRGCVIPGCTAPPAGCDAHHLTYWRDGGGTDLDNLALLCPAHHTAVHAGTWSVEVHDRVPWVRPPPWLDPRRPLLRNAVVGAVEAAHRLGQQLRLDLGADRGAGSATDPEADTACADSDRWRASGSGDPERPP